MEKKIVSLPAVQSETSLNPNSEFLNKGWALKGRREVKRFTEMQKTYLSEKFEVGERTGRKLDPEDVASDMRSAKKDDGTRIFKRNDFLTACEIAS